ncbi:DUF1284 domain-containing protein [Altererythrobacter sp. Root672]|uniref:DUF1284 domain-containing protein n=1 Tax=Altererythrobacter sp. Root672 TaxID=1736584 RepID=UPI0009E8CA83|nr:DUF1284 domain-containing protein [Altererythrobacter sp. Root672]
MTVRLRAHHLLCILTYVGRGYSPAFTVNMTAIAGQISGGEEIEVVEGPDDICAPLLGDGEAHCHRPGVTGRDVRASEDVGRILQRPVRPGSRFKLEPHHLIRLRASFADNQVRSACGGCEWNELCNSISANGFADTIL